MSRTQCVIQVSRTQPEVLTDETEMRVTSFTILNALCCKLDILCEQDANLPAF